MTCQAQSSERTGSSGVCNRHLTAAWVHLQRTFSFPSKLGPFQEEAKQRPRSHGNIVCMLAVGCGLWAVSCELCGVGGLWDCGRRSAHPVGIPFSSSQRTDERERGVGGQRKGRLRFPPATCFATDVCLNRAVPAMQPGRGGSRGYLYAVILPPSTAELTLTAVRALTLPYIGAVACYSTRDLL